MSIDLAVLFPFHIPIYVPRVLYNTFWSSLAFLRITASKDRRYEKKTTLIRLRFPLGMVTAPLIADLFLLAILAIGRQEVHDGTVGADGIAPLDVMGFFLTLAYIAISIDASGIIKWLSLKVLQKGGNSGRLLYLYLYLFFLLLATFVGNDPIVLSGTPFLSYMTRAAANIESPKAWIYTQFAMANIGSAILVSSNPTNLVLSGAFDVTFIVYTANMIVPVLVTAIVLFPFLLGVLFRDQKQIPKSISIHQLDPSDRQEPINPYIPYAEYAQGAAAGGDNSDEQREKQYLNEIMNPYVDWKSAIFGSVVMAAALITVLVLNAIGQKHPVFWITLPGAIFMLCWDITLGWLRRASTREIAREGKARAAEHDAAVQKGMELSDSSVGDAKLNVVGGEKADVFDGTPALSSPSASPQLQPSPRLDAEKPAPADATDNNRAENAAAPITLVFMITSGHQWLQETLPTATAVFFHLPWKLVPFALCMFVLVQALATKGWIAVFAYGWKHWIDRTGTVGAVGGMGFLGVVLSNFAGTNIGTTILLCRVIQAWLEINQRAGEPISQRTFWATVYSMALGVNFGAFSTAFSASLAGLLWRDILRRKHIVVSAAEFAKVNASIIAVTMVVGCAVLVGEVYIVRSTAPYVSG